MQKGHWQPLHLVLEQAYELGWLASAMLGLDLTPKVLQDHWTFSKKSGVLHGLRDLCLVMQ